VDLDGDGNIDVISGSWPGELYFFRGLGKGKFAKGEKIKDKTGKEIKLGEASTVFAADWNGDGVLDLLVGCIDGYVWLVPNEGTAKKPAFGAARKLEADGKVIKVAHGDSHPVVADWDGDGLPDLIVGTGAGSVLWYRNIGTAKEPKLAAAKTLVAESSFGQNHAGSEADRKPPKGSAKDRPCMRAKVCVVDWNGDGHLDLLVGDAGYTESEPPNLTKEEKAAVKKAHEAYIKLREKYAPAFGEQAKLSKPPANETAEAKKEREKKLGEIKEQLKKFQEETQKLVPVMQKGYPTFEWHGHVWLFLRQPPKAKSAKP
jgi:hypothetical protein